MKQDELNRTLNAEIVPSARFVGGVMAAVRREALEPKPIPFPWTRALPGLLAAVIAIVAALVKEAGQPRITADQPSMVLAGVANALRWADQYGIGWIAFAILVTGVCAGVSMRLATGSWRTL